MTLMVLKKVNAKLSKSDIKISRTFRTRPRAVQKKYLVHNLSNDSTWRNMKDDLKVTSARKLFFVIK